MDLSMDPRDIQAVHDLGAAGVTVIVCTGRPFPGATPWVEKLGLEGPIVCYQGRRFASWTAACCSTTGCPRRGDGGDPARRANAGCTSRRTAMTS
jgi:hydroxymethylpyrimidine pyrophosphatase-like HAD family hydrolase